MRKSGWRREREKGEKGEERDGERKRERRERRGERERDGEREEEEKKKNVCSEHFPKKAMKGNLRAESPFFCICSGKQREDSKARKTTNIALAAEHLEFEFVLEKKEKER